MVVAMYEGKFLLGIVAVWENPYFGICFNAKVGISQIAK